MWFKRKKKVVKSFKQLWTEEYFNNCDYYTIVAKVDKWSTAYPMEYMSYAAVPVTEEGWGIVTYKYIVYVYSDEKLAKQRALTLGADVEVIKLHCLSCFSSVISRHFSYADIILDEKWHFELYACRDSSYSAVTHCRLADPEGYYQLDGCAGNDSLQWVQYPKYNEHCHPEEYCRPVAFPGFVIMQRHEAQEGPVDLEMLIDPADLDYYIINDQEYISLKSEMKNNDVVRLFSRPIGTLAFVPTLGEPVIITNGNGVWIPVAKGKVGTSYSVFSWAKHYQEDAKDFYSNYDSIKHVDLVRGPEWYVNRAVSIIENSLFSEEESELTKAGLKELEEYIDFVLSEKPWHNTAKILRIAILENNFEKMKAFVHADRISWLIPGGDIDRIINEYEQGIEYSPHVALLHFVMAYAYRQIDNNIEKYIEYLDKALEVDSSFSRALFDKALIFCNSQDEESEMEYYIRAAEADNDYPEPWYNMAITYRDNYLLYISFLTQDLKSFLSVFS